MAVPHRAGKLAVLLHADVAGSTSLVHKDEHLAHERIQATFRRFGDTIGRYHGRVRELRGDALLAEFERASDAVTAALAFQADQAEYNAQIEDDIRPTVRVGIAMGEVVFADGTVTGAGVVLAQRMEQLAEPGGVCITGAIHESLPQRMSFDQEYLGEREVKGFDEPVRVYAVRLQEDMEPPGPAQLSRERYSPWVRWVMTAGVVVLLCGGGLLAWHQYSAPEFEPVSPEAMALPLPDKPSIAVLPFANMSNDPEQEYFVDGMTEDLITDLSKISGLFVIARNSSFTYKGNAVDVKNVARDLGVRYVLEGSVRRASNQVRINAQLVDATTGGHLWAERYDREYADLFSLQDELIGHIVTALALKLTPIEEKRLVHHETENTQAYDAFLQGWRYYEERTREGFSKAVPFFEKAIKLDPGYGRAHAALAATYWLGWRWLGLLRVDARVLAEEHLKHAMEDPTPVAHRVASLLYTFGGQHEEAIVEAERAIALDPNDPVGYSAMNRALTYAGKPAEAIDYIKKAMRLNPHYPPNYLYRLAYAQFGMGRYDDAAATLERSISRDPDFVNSLTLLAVTYAHLDRIPEAKKTLEHLNELGVFPHCGWAADFKERKDFNRWCEGLRKAQATE